MSLQTDLRQLYALTEREVMYQLDPDAWEHALSYLEKSTIKEPTLSGATLSAIVSEPSGASHAAEISVQDGDVYIACTCDYPGEEICGHIGALLLAWVRQRETFAGYKNIDEPDTSDPSWHQPNLADEYREMLAQQTISDLRSLARNWGIEIKGTRKGPIVEDLATQLSDPALIAPRIAALDSQSQDLLVYLHLILSRGYGMSSEHIITGLSNKYENISRHALYTRLVGLAEQGLLHPIKREHVVYYSLPQAVRMSLPSRSGLVPLYSTDKLDTLDVRERTATAMIQSLYTVWNHIVEQRPRRSDAPARLSYEEQMPQFAGWNHLCEEVEMLVQRRRNPYDLYNVSMTIPPSPYCLHSADRSVLHARTGIADPESDFYYMLLENLHAVKASPGEWISCHQQAFERILSLSPSAQMNLLLHTWIAATTWSEMDALMRTSDDIRVRRNLSYMSFKPNDLYQEWHAGRETVLRFLSTIAEGTWVSWTGFLRTIFEIKPNLIHAHSNAAVWWLESRKTRKQFGTTFEDWEESVGRFILAVLEGPLSWFGAVSLGYQDNKLAAFKVTAVGSLALQRRATLADAESQVPTQQIAQLGDDLTISLVPGQASAQLHDLLHSLGQLESATPERFVYRITADGVLAVLEHGRTIEQVIEQVGTWCGTPVPDAWQEKMRAWSQNYGQMHIYDEITLIELADDYALQEILSNTSLRESVIYQFSPRLVAIRPGDVENLVQEMEKRGYTPHVE